MNLIITENDRIKNEAAAKASVTRLMAGNNPKWRQQIVLGDGVVADMPKPFALEKLIENKCVSGLKFKSEGEKIK